MDTFFRVLLAFVPITFVAEYFHASPIYIFFLASFAIIPLAKYIGEATEELSSHTTAALGGFLNATFGNATELIIALFALQAGLIDVVKASITGSILGNLLFVLGMAIFFGGIKRERQKFNVTAAKVSSSALLLAIVIFAVPAVFLGTTTGVSASLIEEVSIIAAGILLIAYCASLLFTLRTHTHLYTQEVGKYEPKWSTKTSVAVLLGSTVLVAYMSELLVGSIEPLVQTLGWTQLFIGVIFVAIVGNAAEHVSAVTVAIKDKMDLAIQISTGSAAQIAMFVTPVLVFASLFFEHKMNLVFDAFELASMVGSVLVVGAIIEDGESTWLEGVQLLMAYAVIAVAFFFHP